MLGVPAAAGAHGTTCAELRRLTPAIQRSINSGGGIKGAALHLWMHSCSPGPPVRAHYLFTIPSRHIEGALTMTVDPIKVHNVIEQCASGYVPHGDAACVREGQRHTASIGEALKVDGGALTVLPTIEEPANPSSEYDSAAPAHHLAAIHLELTNTGTTTVSSDANNNLTVIGRGGEAYTPAFKAVAGCTNFNYGLYSLMPGAEEAGCVVYELPNTDSIRSLEFSLNLLEGAEAIWSA